MGKIFEMLQKHSQQLGTLMDEYEGVYRENEHRVWAEVISDDVLENMGAILQEFSENKALVAKLKDALIWMSGSADFGPGGQAHKGFVNIVRPLIKPKDKTYD